MSLAPRWQRCRNAQFSAATLRSVRFVVGRWLFAGVGCWVLSGCQPGAATPPPTAAESVASPAKTASALKKVTPVVASLRTWPAVVRVQGSLMADETALIGAKVAGRVKWVKVDLGTVVQQGDVMAQLDSEEFDLRVDQARATLEQQRAKVGLKPGEPEAKLNRENSPPVRQEKAVLDEARELLNRAETLHKENVVTLAELQQRQALLRVAEARYTAALNSVDEQIALLSVRRAELALAIEQQTEAVIRAPFTCIVQERLVAPGTYVKVGDPIVNLVRTDPLRFRGGVPEREALAIELDQKVRVLIDDGADRIEAKVSRISPALDMASRSLQIEVDVPNPGAKLRAGLFAEAEVVVDPDRQLLAVPASAVIEFAGIEKVWLVEQGHLRERRVQTGLRDNDWVEIVDGLRETDRIAANARQVRGDEQADEEELGLASGERHAHGQSE